MSPKPNYAIRASRGAGSMFGAALSWCKDESGQVQTFPKREKAEAEARRLNEGTTSRNVQYWAEEYDGFDF